MLNLDNAQKIGFTTDKNRIIYFTWDELQELLVEYIAEIYPEKLASNPHMTGAEDGRLFFKLGDGDATYSISMNTLIDFRNST